MWIFRALTKSFQRHRNAIYVYVYIYKSKSFLVREGEREKERGKEEEIKVNQNHTLDRAWKFVFPFLLMPISIDASCLDFQLVCLFVSILQI